MHAAVDTSELAVLTAAAHILTLPDGSRVEISPLKVRQIRPMLAALDGLPLGLFNGSSSMLQIMQHADQLAEAAAIATSLPAERLAELDLDDFTRIVLAVVEVNTDFFVRRLQPTVVQGADRLTRLLNPLPPPPGGSTPQPY